MRSFLYRLFAAPQGYTITVSRPTTTDGEQVQLTTTARVGASPKELASILDTCSLAIQRRMAHQNELMMRTNAETAHGIWLRIDKKIKALAAEGRMGIGILSKEERRWWISHATDYDEAGPIVADEKKVAEAAGI